MPPRSRSTNRRTGTAKPIKSQLSDLERQLARCELFLATGGTQAQMDDARKHINDLRAAVHRERNQRFVNVDTNRQLPDDTDTDD
jgi:hypothetical protein